MIPTQDQKRGATLPLEDHAELLEKLTTIAEKLEDLSATDALEGLRREIDELRGHLKRVPYQLECMRRFQQIEGDLRELRTSAATAKFAKEGEPGYISEQSLGEDESRARSSIIWGFSYIEERLDKFKLDMYQGDSLVGLCVDLERLQCSVREEARKSVTRSLNEIASSGDFLADQMHEMLEQMDIRCKELERAKETGDKRNETAQRASEKRQESQLPLSD